MTEVGDLKNSLARPDKISFIVKRFGNSFKFAPKQHGVKIYSFDGWFILNKSYVLPSTATEGDKMAKDISSVSIVGEYVYNDGNIFLETFTNLYRFEDTTTWVADYSTKIITMDTTDLVSKFIYKGDTTVSNIRNTISNIPDEFKDNIDMYIIDADDVEYPFPYDDEIIIPSTNSFKLKLKSKLLSGTQNIPMINTIGKNIVLRIYYG